MLIYMYLLAVIGVVTFLVQVRMLSYSRYKVTETVSSEAIDIMDSLSPAVCIA
jgi:hypothetical protein